MKIKRLTAHRLSIIFGGGIVAVMAFGLVAAVLGMSLPLAAEGLVASVGMLVGAKVA